MTHARPRPDPHALAASLRLVAVEFVVWLAEVLGEGPLSRALRVWTRAELKRLEGGAKVAVLLLALQHCPAPFDPQGHLRRARPLSAPRGFVRVRRRDRIRGATHGLFPRERDLARRARRLVDFLGALDAHARRLAPRAAHSPPASRLVAVAPPAARCASSVTAVACAAHDTS